MKKSLSILVFMFLGITYGMAQEVTLHFEKTKLSTVLSKIEKDTGYTFSYSNQVVDVGQRVSIDLDASELSAVLYELFSPLDIKYSIEKGKKILLKKGLSAETASRGKDIQILQGTVVDNMGAVIGASVLVKGTSNGTTTDFDGDFVLSDVPADATIQISYIGYKTLELPANGDFSHVMLQEDSQMLEEVVVIGYGTVKKKDLMGATSFLSGDKLTTNSNISVGGALQGKMSGISVMSSSGFPGAETNIFIRGIGTFGSGDNAPLIVIDGSPVSSGIEMLNPNDIESVNVLKDASSAAIYGSRASNGVILITTKQGKEGKAQISINANYGIQSPSNVPKVLTASEFVSAILEMRDNKKAIDGGNPTTKYDGLEPSSFGEGTRWSDYIYQVAPTFDINTNISGGSKTMKYYISGEYLNQEGIGINTEYQKVSLRVNLEGNISKLFKVGNNIQLLFNQSKGSRSNRLSDVIFNAPVISAFDKDGTYGEPDGKYTSSKNAISEVAWRTPLNKNYRILDNIFVEFKFSDYLKFRFNGGLDVGFNEYSLFSPIYNDGGQTNNTNSYSDNRKKDLMWVTDYLLYFDKTFGNKHTVNAMVGTSKQFYENDNLNGRVKDFVSEVPNMYVIDGGTNSKDKRLTGSRNQLALGSYFGRINYTYQDKYIIGFNIRADGSSRFKDDNRWGVFPSLSGAWRVSEDFLFNPIIISSFKIRASWGQIGNQSIGSWYPTVASVVRKNVILGEGENQQILHSGYTQTALSNRNLKWETTSVTNVGLDFGSLNNRLQITADYFYKSTDGILRSMVLPPNVGMKAPNVNYAQVINEGLDFEIIYNGKINKFNYTISANASYLHNKIKKLSSGVESENIRAPYGGLYINKVGEALNSMYGYKTGKVITTEEEAKRLKDLGQGNAKVGRLAYIDTNNDGKINEDDRQVLGSYIPKILAGATFSANWKGFDFNTVLSGVFGRKQFSPMSFQNRFPNRNQTRKWYDNRWELGTNPTGKYPAMIQSESYAEMTDLMVANTSYVKVKSLTLGYQHQFNNFSSRIFISGENLLTFAHKDFDGFDPENGITPGHYTNWGGDYPTSRIILVGLNLTF